MAELFDGGSCIARSGFFEHSAGLSSGHSFAWLGIALHCVGRKVSGLLILRCV